MTSAKPTFHGDLHHSPPQDALGPPLWLPSCLQGLPTLVQVMVGVGTPEATQGREAGTPSLVTWWVAVGWILGGTFKNKPIL